MERTAVEKNMVDHSSHATSHPTPAPHIMSLANYYAVFAALIVLTVLTVALSFVEMHLWHVYLGMAIAATKAALVILFFMHVMHSHRLIWSVVIAAMLWLGILVVLTL